MEIKGETVRKVISQMEGPPSRVLIEGVCRSCGSGPPLVQHNIKRGHAEAWESTFTVPTVPPQTLANRSDREGAEARGTAHCAADRRPPTPTTTIAAAMSSSSLTQGISK
jgi:hypothetical protein